MLSPEAMDDEFEVEAVEGAETEEAIVVVEEETAASVPEPISDEPIDPDPVLLAARDQARAALAEITDAASIGEPAGHEVNGAHVLTLFFENTMPGYPGWRWAAAVARVDEESAVNVLEVELLPGPGALTAPAWLPWSERLAQYREAQAHNAEDGAESGAGEFGAGEEFADDDLDDDIMENDFSDFDDEIDGVDIESALSGDDAAAEGEAEGEPADSDEDEDEGFESDSDEDEEE